MSDFEQKLWRQTFELVLLRGSCDVESAADAADAAVDRLRKKMGFA